MNAIPEFVSSDAPDDMAGALTDAGCAVIHGLRTGDVIVQVREELAVGIAAAPVSDDKPDDFYPGKTRRITGLVARSQASHTLALDPVIAGLCQHHLGKNCERYHLHVTAALEIGPGARKQILHREEDPFSFFPLPRPNLVLSTMWAMSDFTVENGATLLVPGSHRWEAGREAKPDEIISATMPKGSVLLWLGGTLHGAGENTSNDWRYGIILSYALGWLRQEENQYLDVPASVAASMSEEMRALVGYPMHGSLGFHDPGLFSQSG